MADHLAGGQMSYECLGANEYKVTLIVYRDCSGSYLADVELNLESSCSSPCVSLGNFNVISTENIDYGCGTISCGGNSTSSFPAVQKITLEKTITLPSVCSDWKLWFDITFRNEVDHILYNANPYQNYILINNENGICNNSPRYLNENFFLGCANNMANFENSYIDDEGDLVTFSLVTPLDGAGCNLSTVSYGTGLSATMPFPSVGNSFLFNPNTGNASFTPLMAGTSFFAIKAKEYRNGVLISESIRDGLIVIQDCPQSSTLNFGNWQNTLSNTLLTSRSEQECMRIYVSSDTIITSLNVTGLPPELPYTVVGIGTPNVYISICPDYDALVATCDNLEYNFSIYATHIGDCALSTSGNENYTLILKGVPYCEPNLFFTNISPTNGKFIPPVNKASERIWVGDNMPPIYTQGGVLGSVEWDQDVIFESGIEVILPSCQGGATDCVTLTAGSTIRIRPNNCSPLCPYDSLEVELREVFNCNAEQIIPTIIGGVPPYSFFWEVNDSIITTEILDIHDFVSNSYTPVDYTLTMFDGAGAEFSGSGQVLGTGTFYDSLTESGVWFHDYPPNSGIYEDGYFYSRDIEVFPSRPFVIWDSVHRHTGGPYYGATKIELTIFHGVGGIFHHQIWDIEGGEDWSIDNAEVYWNGHKDNDYTKSCYGSGGRAAFDYVINANNCRTDGNLTYDRLRAPAGFHTEISGGIVHGCLDESLGWENSHIEQAKMGTSSSTEDGNLSKLGEHISKIDDKLKSQPVIGNDNEYIVYPNPSETWFEIKGNTDLIKQLYVYDSHGKLIFKTTDIEKPIITQSYESGVYLIKLETDERTIYKKMIK